jgi:DNA polymerase-1
MKTTLLIDADILAYKFAAKGQRVYEFGTAVDDLEDVIPKVNEWLDDLMRQTKANDYIICLSCPNDEGWRKRVFPAYKENRKGVVKPELLMPLKEYLEESHPSYRRPFLEADDIMGILSTDPTLVKGRKVIVSEDKDMKTIPGWLFNPEKDKKPRLISEEEADYWHLYQTLVGDATDGYPGCPGIGPKKAEAILQHWSVQLPGDLWLAVNEAFKAKGLTEEDALVQARVARICRSSDYDFKRKEVILWSPHKTTASPLVPSPAA